MVAMPGEKTCPPPGILNDRLWGFSHVRRQLRHLNVGWSYRGQSIRLYVVDDHVDIVTEDGELVGEIILNPERDYQPIIRNHPT